MSLPILYVYENQESRDAEELLKDRGFTVQKLPMHCHCGFVPSPERPALFIDQTRVFHGLQQIREQLPGIIRSCLV